MNRFQTMKPRQVEAYLREQVRKIFGDKVENDSSIFSSHGYYSVWVQYLPMRSAHFQNFRKGDVPKIVKALKALK